jgi:hypothetical protein
MTEKWYYSDGDQPFGPISFEDVSAKIRQATRDQHLVWKEGMADWQNAREAFEFASIFVAPPPISRNKSIASSAPVTLDLSITQNKHRHPWRRYFARIFDLYLFVMFGSFGIGLIFSGLFDNSIQKQNDALLNIVMVAACVPVEAFCLYAFGATIGKALYKIKLTREGGGIAFHDGFKRAFAVWLRGMGAGIPIITLFTLISGYNTLKSKGVTTWDAKYGWNISHGVIKPIGWIGILFAWVIVGGVLLFFISLGSR